MNIRIITSDSIKNACLNHLDKRHMKSIDKINHMREEQFNKEQAKCFPSPHMTKQSKIIIKHIQKNHAYTNRTVFPTPVDHYKIRKNSMKRVIKMFIKEDHKHIEEIVNKRKAMGGISFGNNRIESYKNTSRSTDGINGNSNEIVRQIIETRLKLNKAMGIKSSTLYTSLNDDLNENKGKKVTHQTMKKPKKTNKTTRPIKNTNEVKTLSKSHSQFSIKQTQQYLPQTQASITILPSSPNPLSLSTPYNNNHKDKRLRDLSKFLSYFKITQ